MVNLVWLGISLEICAAALGTTSKQLIAYSSYSGRKWCFNLGATINIAIGPLVDASAYGFAPQVVVAPFACLDVIFNMLTAPCTLSWQQERITHNHIIGTLLVAVGACCTAIFGAVKQDTLTLADLNNNLTKPVTLVYLAAELVAVCAVALMIKGHKIWPAFRGVALGTVAGVLMGNVFFMKGFLCILENAIGGIDVGWNAFLHPTPYICVASVVGGSILGHVFMRKGLAEYKGVFMVTIFEGAHITAACLSGCVVLDELQSVPSWTQVGFYWAGVLTIVLGILIVNRAAGAALARTISGGNGDGPTLHRVHSLMPRTSTWNSFTAFRDVIETPVVNSIAWDPPHDLVTPLPHEPAVLEEGSPGNPKESDKRDIERPDWPSSSPNAAASPQTLPNGTGPAAVSPASGPFENCAPPAG